ncbi:MAG: DUF1616 domain-containing protein [archaeon]
MLVKSVLTKKSAIERIALSFGLSIAIVPLIVFYLNWLFSIKINLINSSVTILAISAIGYYLSRNQSALKDYIKRIKKSLKIKAIKSHLLGYEEQAKLATPSGMIRRPHHRKADRRDQKAPHEARQEEINSSYFL